MGFDNQSWWMLLFLFAATYPQHSVHGQPQVPCLFVFGDSLSDSGNNNNLNTSAKVNFLPYGIDFPTGPTGRFTNGLTSIDFITQMLGFERLIPPFANTRGSDILKGVNYASGSAGIRNETGTHLGANISLGSQLTNHRVIVSRIAKALGSADKAKQYLNKCLYYVNIGSNDYVNNYFLPQHYKTSRMYTTDQYASALTQYYSLQLRALHELGARKFTLMGLNLLGCIPNEIANHGNGVCVDEENNAILIFNDNLNSLVDQFNKELPDAKFIYVNSAVITSWNFSSARKVINKDKCCQVGEVGCCLPNQTPCSNRDLYVFWDSFHPSEIVNQLIATISYQSPVPTYTRPMDISHLVQLPL